MNKIDKKTPIDWVEQLPPDIDPECIELCKKLNSLSNVTTTESCCGHLKDKYMVFFDCNDFIRLGKLYRCVDCNYSDGKWIIEVCCSDGHPCNGFMLRSREPFKTKEEMEKSVNELIENIDYWEDECYNNYFESNGEKESTTSELNTQGRVEAVTPS